MRRIPVWRGAGTGSSPAQCHILVSNSALTTLILVSELCCHLFAITMAGCSQNILIPGQDGSEMRGIFYQGPGAMTFLLIGSLLREDDATQRKKKNLGKHLLIGKICVFHGQCMLCRFSPISQEICLPSLLTEMWESRNYLCLPVEETTCLTDKATLLAPVYPHIHTGVDTLVSTACSWTDLAMSPFGQHVSPGRGLLHPS